MPLPSQSARVSSAGRSPMYRRRRGPGPRVIVIGVVIAAAALVWIMLPSKQRNRMVQPGPANANSNPAPAVEAKKAPPPVVIPEVKAPPPPLVEINQGSGGKAPQRSEAGTSPGSSTTPSMAPVAPAPRNEPAPTTAPSTPAAVPAAPPSPLDQVPSVSAAREAQRTGDLVTARILFSRLINEGKLTPPEETAVREELTKINEDLVFSPKVTPTDPFTLSHKVQSGDSLVKIGQRYKLGPDWRLIQRINRMPDANRLREGQSLKLIRGPFHAVVHKSHYRLDLFMGPTDDESKWLYIRSFTVGLGEGNSTPLGTFIVKKASKLVDPYWVNPRTGERFESSDPKNPIGEFWIGLEGIGESLPHVGYGVHGTIDPDSIGKQKSMGCVRLGNEDVAMMYELLGEQVSLVRIQQ
jgi:hypothetical protein